MQFKRDQLSSLRHRSESEALDQKKASIASQSSLPRGEYLQHVMGPKMNKNSRKLEAINYRKVSGDVDSADLSTGKIELLVLTYQVLITQKMLVILDIVTVLKRILRFLLQRRSLVNSPECPL